MWKRVSGEPSAYTLEDRGRVLQSFQYLLDQIRGQQHNLPATNHVLHTGITQSMLRRPNQRPLALPFPGGGDQRLVPRAPLSGEDVDDISHSQRARSSRLTCALSSRRTTKRDGP
ncbi:unnamed protein product [Arctogadus glacialis]